MVITLIPFRPAIANRDANGINTAAVRPVWRSWDIATTIVDLEYMQIYSHNDCSRKPPCHVLAVRGYRNE